MEFDAEAARKAAVNEVGTEAGCPFCKRGRVRRSDYIRCIGCGINWLDGEDIRFDPRAERRKKFMGSFTPGQQKGQQQQRGERE